jgi:hypothetical protein
MLLLQAVEEELFVNKSLLYDNDATEIHMSKLSMVDLSNLITHPDAFGFPDMSKDADNESDDYDSDHDADDYDPNESGMESGTDREEKTNSNRKKVGANSGSGIKLIGGLVGLVNLNSQTTAEALNCNSGQL